MEILLRTCLFIAGIINLLPSILAFMPQKITASYGITLPDVNFELLLRHRAVLFGIIGGVLIYAAISKKYYDLSVVIGMVSMISYLILYFLMDVPVNTQLRRVMQIDVVGVVILGVGYLLHRLMG